MIIVHSFQTVKERQVIIAHVRPHNAPTFIAVTTAV